MISRSVIARLVEAPGSDGVIHVIRAEDDFGDDFVIGEVWRMYCGATTTVVSDDGEISPPIDFFDLLGASRATCPGCRRALGFVA